MIQATVNIMIAQLLQAAKESSLVNLKDCYNYLSFDIMGHVTFSESFGCLEDERYHHWADALQKYFKTLALNATAGFFPVLQPLMSRLVPKGLQRRRQNHLSQIQQVVQNRFTQEKEHDKTDFLACARNEKKGLSLTEEEIEALMSVTLLAGSEATATSLLSIMHHLLLTPTALLRLTKEIRTTFNEESEITMASVANIPYLDAVINESLRLGSSVPGILSRFVPDPGAVICGYWLSPEVRDRKRTCLIR